MSPTANRAWTGLFVALALSALGAAAAALIAVEPNRSPIDSPMVLAVGESRRAVAALRATPRDLQTAEAANLRAVALAPYDSSARLRIAHIDALDGELGPEGLAAFSLSYQLLPFDQYVANWRIGFALKHWGDLSAETRLAVEAEAFAFAATSRRRELLATLAAVNSPTGVLPATIWAWRIRRDASGRTVAQSPN